MGKIKKLRVVPFEIEHLEMLRLRDFETYRADYNSVYGKGIGYSAFDDQVLIFCAGFVFLWEGVAETWILCDKCVIHYIRELYYYVASYLDRIISKYNLHRIQATVLAEYLPGRRFLGRMGFREEGLLRKYDWNGRDYFMYSRVM